MFSADWHRHRATGFVYAEAGDEIRITIPPIGTLVNKSDNGGSIDLGSRRQRMRL